MDYAMENLQDFMLSARGQQLLGYVALAIGEGLTEQQILAEARNMIPSIVTDYIAAELETP